MNSKHKTVKANTVSRYLKLAGFLTVKEQGPLGMRVRRSASLNRVHVTAQFDSNAKAIRMATEAAEELRAVGYTVAQDHIWLCVTVN